MEVGTTERLRLRSWSFDDIPRFRSLATNEDVIRFIGPGTAWSDDRCAYWIGTQVGYQHGHGFSMWALREKDDEEVIGCVGLQPIPEHVGLDEVEIGWWIAPEHWGKGLATEAAQFAHDFAFERTDLQRFVARAYAANTASIRIMEKLGMTFERPFGDGPKGDVVLYAKARAR